MTTLLEVKNGQEVGSPIYKQNPYILLSAKSKGPVLSSGVIEDLKKLPSYYDHCVVEVREHDLYMNNNEKIAS